MKKFLVLLLMCVFCLTGCSEDGSSDEAISEKYSIGEEVELGGVLFNIYKIDDSNNELYLLAQSNVGTTTFSDSERPYDEQHDYEGSLVEGYVNKFVDELEDKGYSIKSSGIIDKDDLYNLGFVDSVTKSGRPYICEEVPEFVKYEENYWLSGYYKVETYSWVYSNEEIDTQSCEDEYGVRPIIVIEPSEIDKQPQIVDENLTIKDIVNSDCVWTSEGGIANPYDLFYFDCENMTFTNVFESSEMSHTSEYDMKFVDEKTIQIDGLRRGYDYPAEITIVNENKLRIRFLDDKHNDGDYYLNKVDE